MTRIVCTLGHTFSALEMTVFYERLEKIVMKLCFPYRFSPLLRLANGKLSGWRQELIAVKLNTIKQEANAKHEGGATLRI